MAKQRPRCRGTLSSFWGGVSWKLPDFFSIFGEDPRGKPNIKSPPFAIGECTWRLIVYPKGNEDVADAEYMAVFLGKDDPNVTVKAVNSFSISLRNQNAVIVSKTCRPNRPFEEGSLYWGWHKFLKLDDLQKRKSELPPSCELSFMCEMELPKEVVQNPEEVNYEGRIFMGLEALSTDFKDLLSSDWECDVTVNVQGRVFRAHRIVLAARSPVFRAMFGHDTTEAKTGVLHIPDCDPESFGEFINFLYTGRLETTSFLIAYHLYVTADKYDVQQLKSFCVHYMQRNLTSGNICDVALLADRFGDHNLQSWAQEFFRKNSPKVTQMSQWKAMLEDNPRIADMYLSNMASAASKSSCTT